MNDVVRDPGWPVSRAGTAVSCKLIASSLSGGTVSVSSSDQTADPGGIETVESPLKVNATTVEPSTRSPPLLRATTPDDTTTGWSPNSFESRRRQRDPPSVTCTT